MNELENKLLNNKNYSIIYLILEEENFCSNKITREFFILFIVALN